METEIKAINVDYLYGGGYYELKEVLIDEDDDVSESTFLDIYILIESIDNMDDLKDLKLLAQKAQGVPEKKGTNTSKGAPKFLRYSEIAKSLNGYGRFVQYNAYGVNSPQNMEVLAIQEGRFKAGCMDGYCRHYDGTENGFVEVGFFKEGEPYGKYQSFQIDGKKSQEGIKEGEKLVKEISIANYLTRVVKLGKDAQNLPSNNYSTGLARQ